MHLGALLDEGQCMLCSMPAKSFKLCYAWQFRLSLYS